MRIMMEENPMTKMVALALALLLAGCVSLEEQAQIDCAPFNLPPDRHASCLSDSMAMQGQATGRAIRDAGDGIYKATEPFRHPPPQVIIVQPAWAPIYQPRY